MMAPELHEILHATDANQALAAAARWVARRGGKPVGSFDPHAPRGREVPQGVASVLAAKVAAGQSPEQVINGLDFEPPEEPEPEEPEAEEGD